MTFLIISDFDRDNNLLVETRKAHRRNKEKTQVILLPADVTMWISEQPLSAEKIPQSDVGDGLIDLKSLH